MKKQCTGGRKPRSKVSKKRKTTSAMRINTGLGTSKNIPLAKAWLQKAKENGDADASNMLQQIAKAEADARRRQQADAELKSILERFRKQEEKTRELLRRRRREIERYNRQIDEYNDFVDKYNKTMSGVNDTINRMNSRRGREKDYWHGWL